MRTLTRISAPALVSLLLVAAPAAMAAAEQRDSERVDRTVQIRAGGQLRLKNFSGRVTITGSNRGDMAVHAVRRATRDRLDHIRLEILETASGVTIEANKKDSDWRDRENNVVDTEFDIELPADVSVDVEVFSSDVEVRDVRGKQRVHTFSGDVALSGGEKSIDADTFSGNISVKLIQGASAAIDFDSFSGSIRTDVPLTYRGSGRRHVRAEIGAGGTDYNFKTFSGDLRIR
jgi:lipopolysaccharide export system protein LptA